MFQRIFSVTLNSEHGGGIWGRRDVPPKICMDWHNALILVSVLKLVHICRGSCGHFLLSSGILSSGFVSIRFYLNRLDVD